MATGLPSRSLNLESSIACNKPFPAVRVAIRRGDGEGDTSRGSVGLPFAGTVAFALAHCIFLFSGQLPMRETTVPMGVSDFLGAGLSRRGSVFSRREEGDR